MQEISTSSSVTTEQLPEYLTSYDLLQQHIRGQLEGLTTTDKGRRFAQLVQRLVAQTEVGANFEAPEINPKQSNDDGIDLTAHAKQGNNVLYIQSKLSIDRVEYIDGIISKFQQFSTNLTATKQPQLSMLEDNEITAHFSIVTLSPLSTLVPKYEKSSFSSKNFYNELKEQGRIHFIDGHQISATLQNVYKKINQTPADLVLDLETDFIQKDNVYLAVISNQELKRLYHQFGDALFFENIRDFIGLPIERSGRTTPNQEITRTVRETPEKMLERNNDIVIRAEEVLTQESTRRLRLSRGSIVNGCQTTMCIIEADNQCFVPVKIVQTGNSWDVAKAANHQNPVKDIDLDLARHLRPQIVKRAAAMTGLHLDDGQPSAFQILDVIYSRKIAYHDTRLLYIGFFSRKPNNVFVSNYTELLHTLIDKFYAQDPNGEIIFETLFMLQEASQSGLIQAKSTFTHESYAQKFKRLYAEEKSYYRCFVTILAICGAVNVDVSARMADPTAEFDRLQKFFADSRSVLENRKDRFLRYYVLAVKVWMQAIMDIHQDDNSILKEMHRQSSTSTVFTNMFRSLCMEADTDIYLQNEGKEFENKTK